MEYVKDLPQYEVQGMAYIKQLEAKCDAGCKRKATVEVFNNQNASIGKFCRTCGIKKLRELQSRGV